MLNNYKNSLEKVSRELAMWKRSCKVHSSLNCVFMFLHEMAFYSTFRPKLLMFTLAGFVRSFISRKAYLLSLCTCEWLQGRHVKVNICVNFGNDQCKTKWDAHLSAIFTSSLCFFQQKQIRSLCYTSTNHRSRIKTHRLWNFRNRSRQILAETSLSDGQDPFNVSDHVQVKSPPFSRLLQLFFGLLLWRWH